MHYNKGIVEGLFSSVQYSVPDTWRFGVDPDPDPRIHASD
jgi:hypothetical protein